jgi:hypothetical protein
MNYRYFQGWKKREHFPRAAYLLVLLLPAFVIVGGWTTEMIG